MKEFAWNIEKIFKRNFFKFWENFREYLKDFCIIWKQNHRVLERLYFERGYKETYKG